MASFFGSHVPRAPTTMASYVTEYPRSRLWIARRWAGQIYITSSPVLLWSFICSGHHDKSCSDHFVLNVASLVPFATRVSINVKAFPSRPSVLLLITNSITTSLAELFSTSFRSGHLGYVKCAHFIHDSITLTSSEFDVYSDGPPVLMSTSVHRAFEWRFLAVPVCLCLSQISQPMPLSNCVSYGSDVFHARLCPGHSLSTRLLTSAIPYLHVLLLPYLPTSP
ncbi:hypothetical protein T07_6640 [Trichinella nelsoni]|uniref:Uncharacterized protein n=1 Tax=Trichinella nelsoni TaxID=6336 RepID=A0A0V0RQI6_9BILA|nr:hypothetical protein T07_6640 [Trichinella nelsoni]